jgi:hypothetical protein
MLKIILELQTDGHIRRVEFVDSTVETAYSLGVLIGEAVAVVEAYLDTPNHEFLDRLQEGIIDGLPEHITDICKDEE